MRCKLSLLDPRTNMSHVYFETEKAELSHEINLNVSQNQAPLKFKF